MKTTFWLSVIGITFTAFCFEAADEPTKQKPEETIPSDYIREQITALSALLYHLAAERHEAHTKRGETWILTVHAGNKVQKYTDGKLVVASLPAVSLRDYEPACRYALHYNKLQIQVADHKVIRGEYEGIEEYFNTLLYFDSCAFLKDEIEKRLTHLRRLKSGKDIKESRDAYQELQTSYFTRFNVSDIEGEKPTFKPDLMRVPVSRL